MRPKPLLLVILDGWGYRAEREANAVALANKPTYDKLLREYPNTLINTSGRYVGLPNGQMGNSEVGHLNSGAGYLQKLQQKLREFGGAIASVNGRYYAMDRDRRWPREEKAFAAMVEGRGEGGSYADPVQGIKNSYNQGVTDEFVVPFVVT